jgi:DMSO/TMAO reductase YedYZ molybdopterin-dependent catalytic subunit
MASAGGALLSACALTAAPSSTGGEPTQPAVSATGTAPADVVPWTADVPLGTILRNEDVPGFYVRFIRPFAAVNPGAWHLTIKGLVDAPTTLTLEQIASNLAYVEQNTRMHCVEGWSSRVTWGGFTYAALAALVSPQPEAKYLTFLSEDGYYEELPVSELQKPRALFTTHMEGNPLAAKHGAPVRMIMPWLYGYKGAKTIHTIEFKAQAGDGWWSENGFYPPDGVIGASYDIALDLGGKVFPIAGGEITDH